MSATITCIVLFCECVHSMCMKYDGGNRMTLPLILMVFALKMQSSHDNDDGNPAN